MAASEYYYGSAATQAPNSSHPYPPQPQPQHQPQYQQQPPPPYSPYQQPQQYASSPPKQSYQGYPQQPSKQPPQAHPPYPSNGRPGTLLAYPEAPPARLQNYPPPPRPQNGYLGAPLQPHRSHSQPPRVQRVRFEDDLYDSDSSGDRSYPSDSDYSSRRRHRRRKHRSSHAHDSLDSRSASPDRERSHSHSHSHSQSHHRHHESRTQRKEHKDRSTFLGAGVGGLIGDAIVPGLGTAAGLLLGGYGGRKAARKRSQSEGVADREYYPHRGRAQGESGWDEESATFRKGHAVR